MANPIVTGLSAYVEEHRLPLITKSVIGAKTLQYINVMTDVKGDSALNLLNTNVVFQDGNSCGWQASGTTELSQRVLKTNILKVNQAFCNKNLVRKWAEYQVKMSIKDEHLAFEEEFTNDIVNNIQAKIEQLIWAGRSGQTNEFAGLIEVATAASATTNNVSEASGTSAYTAIKDVYDAIPQQILSKAKIFVSEGLYRQFIQGLVTANLYHFAPDYDGGTYKLPGTNIDVVALPGLDNASASYEYIFAGDPMNLYYGCDLSTDSAEFDLWFSKDAQEHRLAVQFNGGTQIAIPSELVVGKIALN